MVAYFDPDTAANFSLRQSLTYFLPVYCHSRAENAHRMAEIAVPTITKLATLREALQDEADVEEGGDTGMVKLSQIATMLVDWTDPRKMVGFAEASSAASTADDAGATHFILADSLLERLNHHQVQKEEKKVLISMLAKMHFPPGGCDADLLKEVMQGLTEAQDTRLAPDATSRTTLTKVYDALLKQISAVAAAERGGSVEETGLETTEYPTAGGAEATEANIMDDFDAADVDGETTVLPVGKPDRTSVGATTFGGPADAEGTRVQLGVGEDDGEMMDVDGEEYTQTEISVEG